MPIKKNAYGPTTSLAMTKNWLISHKPQTILQRIICPVVASVIIITLSMYSVALTYQHRHKNEPLVWGATFIESYARELGLNPRETLSMSINDLGIKRYRLVSYWNEHEKTEGNYDFSQLDWQIGMIEQAGGSVTLSLGLRQPRWPECHGPEWAMNKTIDNWYPNLKSYIQKVVERYRDRKVIVSWQLENEFLLDAFGKCPDHSRWRLIDEYELLRKLDGSRPIIVTRSNNAMPSWPIGQPSPDIVGAAVYKRIWDKYITKRYFEYPIPAWYYAFLAGGEELTTGKPSFIHELQAEPWLPEGMTTATASTEEMYKSMSPEIMKDRLQYAQDTGIRTIDMWGLEWWYFMKQNHNQPEIWNIIKSQIAETSQQ